MQKEITQEAAHEILYALKSMMTLFDVMAVETERDTLASYISRKSAAVNAIDKAEGK